MPATQQSVRASNARENSDCRSAEGGKADITIVQAAVGRYSAMIAKIRIRLFDARAGTVLPCMIVVHRATNTTELSDDLFGTAAE